LFTPIGDLVNKGTLHARHFSDGLLTFGY